jgi:radical SAM-linked protein
VKQRVRFAKHGKVRFLSHRDVARVWERALRRAGIRVAYSEGFSPRPRLSFGLALSAGYESLGEYLDIDLAEDIEPDELVALVNPSLPQGMEAQAAVRIPPGTESLQQAVLSSSWQIEVADIDADRVVERAVEKALTASTLPIVVERKGSETELDARPAILFLAADGTTLTAELATHPRSLRPAELLRAVDPTWTARSVLRTHQWTSVDGARCEPIPFGDLGARGATSTPHAGARA